LLGWSSVKTISRVAIIIPFFGFLLGYFVTHWLMQKDEVATPNVIGKSLQESVVILSRNNLSVRLLHEQEDAVLPAGTIIDQIPKPYQKVKPNQNVFVTISKRESLMQVPDFYGHQHDEVAATAKKRGIDLHAFFVVSNLPKGRCIAQQPQAGTVFERNRMMAYFSAGQTSLCVLPSFKEQPVKEVEEFLKFNNIQLEVLHDRAVSSDHQCTSCRVVDQRPMAGSIIDTTRKITVQIQAVGE
jgi:beta-lactam-binding protein with PASTA domain